MKKKNSFVYMILLFCLVISAGADPVISLVADKNLYALGEEVKVKILARGSEPIGDIYFDIPFDPLVVTPESIDKGGLIKASPDREMLYAWGEERLVFSATLPGLEAPFSGVLGEVVFRVTGRGENNARYSFSFDSQGLYDPASQVPEGTIWENSAPFSLINPYNGAYVTILAPYENQVFYEDSVNLTALTVEGKGIYARARNLESNFLSSPVEPEMESLEIENIPLEPGFNRIVLHLYDSSGSLIADDRVTVFRSPEDKFIKILSPTDHALINTDMVEVKVSSPFSQVQINGTPGEAFNEGEDLLYRSRMWLKEGFNTITASARSPEGAVYTDSIIVFYQRNDNIFHFITPFTGQTYKPGSQSFLNITGEMGTLYNKENIKNQVTLKVIYYPFNPLSRSRVLLDEAEALISESTGNSQGSYFFSLAESLSLEDLESGEIEIIAYKNKEGRIWEDEIHRFVIVDSNVLSIDLIQPNIFGLDLLDTRNKVRNFNFLTDPSYDNVELADDGSFQLRETEMIIRSEMLPDNIPAADMIELKDGTIYLLANDGNTMRIYTRRIGETRWLQVLSQEDMHGYALCETDIGVLVGVTNIFQSTNSGLYLLNEEELKNISIGEPITHVQFIEYRKGEVYLYGNNYSHLYSFNIFSLEENDSTLSASVVTKVPFDNQLLIDRFCLSRDGISALLLTTRGEALFYQNLSGNAFTPLSAWDDYADLTVFSSILYGFYEEGNYNAFLLLRKDSTRALAVMEHKTTHRLIINTLDMEAYPGGIGLTDIEFLKGAGFRDGSFYFLKDTGTTSPYGYTLSRGKVFFEQFYIDEEQTFEGSTPLLSEDLSLLATSHNTAYTAFKKPGNNGFFQFLTTVPPAGSIEFYYNNTDIEGINGFSFELDPIWFELKDDQEKSYINFGFSLETFDGEEVYSPGTLDLEDFLNLESSLFETEKAYDAQEDKYTISLNFNRLQEESRLFFHMDFRGAGNFSPELSQLTIKKKASVKIPRSGDEVIRLPIRGFIHDPTVSQVVIKGQPVNVERNGAFAQVLPINSTESSVPVTIYCENSSGESAQLSFRVEIFDSINMIGNIALTRRSGDSLEISGSRPYEFSTQEEFIRVEGNFFGLAGVQCGYELYDYVFDQGQETLALLSRGIFGDYGDYRTLERDSSNPGWSLPAQWPSDPGGGYEYGRFSGQEIQLYPGRQRLVLYVENPGGARSEYTVDSNGELYHPDIVYSMPEIEQRIEITNLFNCYNLSGVTYNNVPVSREIKVRAYETSSEPYLFKSDYLIRGEVRSLYQLYNLNIVSSSPSLLFENGKQEMIISLDSSNRFTIPVSMVLPEECESESMYITITPTAPFLAGLRTGVRVEAVKSFGNTCVIPDFTLMNTKDEDNVDHWTEEERGTLNKPMLLDFHRYIPQGTNLTLVVNFEYANQLHGTLIPLSVDSTTYSLVDDNNQPLSLNRNNGLKYGLNRVLWSLSYRGEEISSSSSGRLGMKDFLFNLDPVSGTLETEISFDVENDIYYNDKEGSPNRLPLMGIVKDRYTLFELYLNNHLYIKDDNFSDTSLEVDFCPGPLLQGRNQITLEYTEGGIPSVRQYEFLYDSRIPEIYITGYSYTEDYREISTLEGIVKEENLKNNALFYGNTKIDIIPEVIYQGAGMYRLVWQDLEDYSFLDIIPSAVSPVRISAEDRAGQEGWSASFTGIEMYNRDQLSSPLPVDLSPLFYRLNDPTPDFHKGEPDPNFPDHGKFFNSSLFMNNYTIAGTVVEERSGPIYAGDGLAIGGRGNLILRAGERLRVMPDFRMSPGGRLRLEPASYAGLNNISFSHNETSEAMTFVFWFRPEHEPYSADATDFHRILTLYDSPQESVYLAYREKDLFILYENYNNPGMNRILMGNEQPISLLGNTTGDWHQIALGIDNTDTENRSFYLSVNNALPVSKVVTEVNFESILLQDNSYFFGTMNQADSGYFSIAEPFYINQIIGLSDLVDLIEELEVFAPHTASLYNIGGGYNYTFDYPGAHQGDDFYNLHTQGEDYFVSTENVNYNEDAAHGALKGTDRHRNLLKVSEYGQVLFDNSEKPITINLDVTTNNSENTITLSPEDPAVPGKYYMGNTFGNHGLKPDHWYSVSGSVISLVPGSGDSLSRLVLSIDGNLQRFPLTEGDFHFIYEHDYSAPSTVIMYIETSDTITFKRDISFNEGNFAVPFEGSDELEQSFATTRIMFRPSGTVSLWYKPFNVNPEGFSNYKTVLIDSEFLTLGTRRIDPEDHTSAATYYVELKGGEFPFVLHTATPVRPGWQHLQVSFSLTTGHNGLYLYVDGKCAGRTENIDIPPSPSMLGQTPASDNVALGTNLSFSTFAEGFLDDISFSHVYQEVLFEDKNPLNVSYNQGAVQALSLSLKGPYTGLPVEEIKVTLEDKEHKIRQVSHPLSLADHGLNTASLDAGIYRLTVEMLLNGHRFTGHYSFLKNHRPSFNLKSMSPIVIYNRPTDIFFTFQYDDSYLREAVNTIYAGFAVRLTYPGLDGVEENKTLYVVQNFNTQDGTSWLIRDPENGPWVVLKNDGSLLPLVFENVSSMAVVNWEMRSFYFSDSLTTEDIQTGGTYGFDALNEEKSGEIFDARLSVNRVTTAHGKEYKLQVILEDFSAGQAAADQLLRELGIRYEIHFQEDLLLDPVSRLINLNGQSSLELYYDDLLYSDGLSLYGHHEVTISLVHLDQTYYSEEVAITWERSVEEITVQDEASLSIVDFSLLSLNKEDKTARLYLEFNQSALSELHYDLYLFPEDNSDTMIAYEDNDILNITREYVIINDVDLLNGTSYIKIDLYDNKDTGFLRSASLTIINSTTVPEVILTNEVPSLIAYNNVQFTWRGYHEGVFKEDIRYSYSFDNQGWSAPSAQWREADFYNLSEGYHNFRVKAIYNGEESPEAAATFFVDIDAPVFDESFITVKDIYSEDNMRYAVTIIGDEGAVKDASLKMLTLNGEEIKVTNTGAFAVNMVDLEIDGINRFTLTAYDKVGNFKDYVLDIDNTLTNIFYPLSEVNVKYAPLTISGQIDQSLNTPLDIYLFDISCMDRGEEDFSGWKKAVINEDHTFFIENVYVNPGTSSREAYTPLYMVTVFKSGLKFYKKLDLWANEVVMPLDMILSTHAVEGETSNTTVTIDCKANVNNISTWSVDFNGDGIYDLIDVVDNPRLGREHSWTHVYSSLGIVKPRVRIITTDGFYFSVSDEIIIHEKIKEASHLMVSQPISFSLLSQEDGSSLIFQLRGDVNSYSIDLFRIGRNENYISNRLYSVSLKGYDIDDPVAIRALDKDNLFIVSNLPQPGTIHHFRANQFDNYLPVSGSIAYTGVDLKDLTIGEGVLYATPVNAAGIIIIPLEEGILNNDKQEFITPQLPDTAPLGVNLSLSASFGSFLAADYYNQRIMRFSDSFKVLEYAGAFGTGEREFIKPALIRARENRVFVYDDGREDIQVFDAGLKTVTTLKYTPGEENYFEPGFLTYITDMDMVTREENGRVYYYALVLSRSLGKLAMIRLPQWEELRVRARNNKIVFLKEDEVFIAKPDGSDLMRVVASDAIPRVSGSLDYPALSPDGRHVVFTSKVRLYDGSLGEVETDNVYTFDNLYMIRTEGGGLTRIPLGEIKGYEIERPVFNYNGNRIIFSAKAPGENWQIYIYDLETGGIQRLFTSEENARFPYFSPDDRFVVFTTDYDGDEEIEIFDSENPSVRVSVTSNNSRDSFPVWGPVYPFEISNPDLDIESKILFVSERGFRKGLHYVYISRPSDSDVRVVTAHGDEVGDDPDSAALSITTEDEEGDYPALTGDGTGVVFEYFNGDSTVLRHYDFDSGDFSPISLPSGASRPAGMKNCIANFQAEAVNGDEVHLTWTRYTDQDIFYILRFRVNREGEPFVQKKIFTQDSTTIKGLEMGVEYLFRVSIIENNVEAAASQWKKVLMPEVAARPSYTVDEDNPYLVHLSAWKPDPQTEWNFTWIIDNQEIPVQSSQEYLYEFATSGKKNISLKASNKGNTYTSVSDKPLVVDIVSDIHPVVEYVLAEDSSYIELDATQSVGSKIDWSSTTWTISGPGQQPLGPVSGSKVIVPLNGFQYKVNVNLTLRRVMVNGQSSTDILEKNIVVDLSYKDIKPVITYDQDFNNPRLFRFTGEHSLGNIDWYRAQWDIYADGAEIHHAEGVSSFAYQFPEDGNTLTYSVALTLPRRNDGQTQTSSILVSVESAPMEPVIDYEILTIQEGSNITGAKILLSASKSRGSNIDFTQARWSVPVAGTYGDQPQQIGPTAIYNLMGISGSANVEVSLTLIRRGGSDVVTVTKVISIGGSDVAKTEIVVKTNEEITSTGKTIVFDALSSTGPDIEWEKTEWLLDGQYSRKGPAARLDIPESGEKRIIPYTCTLYRGTMTPIIKHGKIEVGSGSLQPHITYRKLPGTDANVFEFSVEETEGINIDWSRTEWGIFDGNREMVVKYGSRVTHTFTPRDEAMGYPVMVEMYFKESSLPFVGYASVDIDGDELIPIITYDTDQEDKSVIHFSAYASQGANIDWTQVKWTFGDSSESAYGPSAVHEYPLDQESRNYRVGLTLVRKLDNGVIESETGYKNINIGSDKIQPVIHAQLLNNGFLVLSAEESEGRGLLLERSTWLFEGEGDSENLNINRKVGTVTRMAYNTTESSTTGSSSSTGASSSESSSRSRNDTEGDSSSVTTGTSITAGASAPATGGPFSSATTSFSSSISSNSSITTASSNSQTFATNTSISSSDSQTTGASETIDTTSYDDFIDNTVSFSTQNSHTGAVCRRYVGTYDIATAQKGERQWIGVTLFVFRAGSDGGTEGVSITAYIDLTQAAENGGVTYE